MGSDGRTSVAPRSVDKPTVLVVDDERLVGQAIADLLEDDYVVLTADCGSAGLKILNEHPEIVVILCDQRMPQMEGGEFLERANQSSQATRILITGFADLDAVVRAVNRGHIHTYLSKPFGADQLRLTVGAAYGAYKIAHQLQEERDLLHGLMDNIPDLIAFRDEAGRFLRINHAKAKRFGLEDPQLAIGFKESDFVPDDQASKIIAAEGVDVTSDKPLTSRDWCTQVGDELRWWSTIAAPIRNSQGQFTGSVAITRDITDRKATEQQLQQSQKMEAIGTLTGGLAHDFNNLLAVVIGNLDLLADEAQLAPSMRELINDATAAALRGAELTRSLLAFSRRQPLQPKQFDVNDRVAIILKLLQRLLGEDIETSFLPGPNLWPVDADPVQLESALANLAANARDAMPSGGRFVVETRNVHLDDTYVEINPEAAVGDYVLIQASDNGCGMKPEVLTRVIEPFFTTKPTGKGTGLGLSMVYGFIKQSGGHFKIYSEVELGTTLRLYLPRAQTQSSTEKLGKPKVAKERNGPSKTILVVDDNVDVRQMAVRQLEKLGHRVHQAADGREALEQLSQLSSIDLMLADVVMPGGMSGIELAKEARMRWPGLKVLFASGFPATMINDGQFGSDDILLSKPYRQQELADCIAEALKRKKEGD